MKEREAVLGCGDTRRRLGWSEAVGVAVEVGEEAPHGGGREGEEGGRSERVSFGTERKRAQGFGWGQVGSQRERSAALQYRQKKT